MIETRRLIIRPWGLEDVPLYQALSTDIGYNCFAPPGIYLTKDSDAAMEKIQMRMDLFDHYGIGKFPMFEKEGGKFVGTCGAGFFIMGKEKQLELGYRLMLEHWGKGYATEAALALLDYLINQLGISKLFGYALPQNQQSLKILQKIGFHYMCDFYHHNLSYKLFEFAGQIREELYDSRQFGNHPSVLGQC